MVLLVLLVLGRVHAPGAALRRVHTLLLRVHGHVLWLLVRLGATRGKASAH